MWRNFCSFTGHFNKGNAELWSKAFNPMHKEAHHLSDVKKTTIGVILRLREQTNKRLMQKLFSTSEQEANCWTSCSWFQTLYLRLIIISGQGRDFCPTHTQPPFYKQWVTQVFLSVFRYSEQWHHRFSDYRAPRCWCNHIYAVWKNGRQPSITNKLIFT